MRFALNRRENWKSIRISAILWPVLLCLVLAGPFAAFGQEHQEKLGKKELKSLIAKAKSAEDHLRLAAHYRAEANEYLVRQKQHLEDEKEYNQNPQKYPTKYPTPAQHCRDWAYNDGQAAKKALALAEMHEAMARDAAK
jgi:hypothetical protein